MLRAIQACPFEDTPRLAYADWLDENGKHARAFMIRTEIKRYVEDETTEVSSSLWRWPRGRSVIASVNLDEQSVRMCHGEGDIADIMLQGEVCLVARAIPGIVWKTRRGFPWGFECQWANFGLAWRLCQEEFYPLEQVIFENRVRPPVFRREKFSWDEVTGGYTAPWAPGVLFWMPGRPQGVTVLK